MIIMETPRRYDLLTSNPGVQFQVIYYWAFRFYLGKQISYGNIFNQEYPHNFNTHYKNILTRNIPVVLVHAMGTSLTRNTSTVPTHTMRIFLTMNTPATLAYTMWISLSSNTHYGKSPTRNILVAPVHTMEMSPIGNIPIAPAHTMEISPTKNYLNLNNIRRRVVSQLLAATILEILWHGGPERAPMPIWEHGPPPPILR